MPGLLKDSAACPVCNVKVEAVIRTTTAAGVVAEYFHERPSAGRRKRRCSSRVTHAADAVIRARMNVAPRGRR